MALRIFFRFNTLIFICFLKCKTIETHVRAFLPLNISAVGSVNQNIKVALRITFIKLLILS